MENNLNNPNNSGNSRKRSTLFTLGGIILTAVVIIAAILLIFKARTVVRTEALEIKTISSVIQADGAVTPQTQATLHFQIGGKLTYMPFKEGDKVYQGETIAQLDTYALQKQLSAALNTYRSTRDTFDQTNENANNNLLQTEQVYPYNTYGAGGIGGNAQYTAINDVIKRIVDQNQANLDNSVIKVQLANYALQMATLTSPIDGVITHLDVTTPQVNVTPATSFTVADPTSLVFRTDVPQNDIDFVSVGNKATIELSGGKSIAGVVERIYPDKITLSSGQEVYEVDVESTKSGQLKIMGQSGTALIQSDVQNNVKLVPTWTVLGQDAVWVLSKGKPVLRNVTTGKTHGDMTEILSGLKKGDKIITDPKFIAAQKYQILL